MDPLGRLFSNATGHHVYSQPILDIGVEAALRQVTWDAAKFVARGGLYPWSPVFPVASLTKRPR